MPSTDGQYKRRQEFPGSSRKTQAVEHIQTPNKLPNKVHQYLASIMHPVFGSRDLLRWVLVWGPGPILKKLIRMGIFPPVVAITPTR